MRFSSEGKVTVMPSDIFVLISLSEVKAAHVAIRAIRQKFFICASKSWKSTKSPLNSRPFCPNDPKHSVCASILSEKSRRLLRKVPVAPGGTRKFNQKLMLRTHTCGELRIADVNKQVTLSGWTQRLRDKGSLLWIDLRDRYGITQLFLEEGKSDAALLQIARTLGREFVIKVEGVVAERHSKNANIPTGEIEIIVSSLEILNQSKTPPFTIEDETDGGDDFRMKYRYLDLRRNVVRESLQLRHKVAQQTRVYMDAQHFIEVETPVLIKSTPEGARDFVVPSRMNQGEFY